MTCHDVYYFPSLSLVILFINFFITFLAYNERILKKVVFMYKLLLFPISILLLAGCGGEPTPKENSMAEMRAKMEARQKQRFSKSSYKKTKKKESTTKRSDDPTAYVYKGKVLSLKEEKVWADAGIDNKSYVKWVKLGMEPEEVKEWKALGLSYAAISVMKKMKYTPAKAERFLNKKFASRPSFYKHFGSPVYEFDEICKNVIKRQQPPFAFLEERCLPYMKESHKNEVIGHLLDESKVKKGPLPLEYLSELRRLADTNSKIQSGMEVTIEEFIDDEEKENFVFLFPLMKNEPTEYEMQYIDKNRLPLQKSERYRSYQNREYWIEKEVEKKLEEEAAKRQEALLKAKKKSERTAILKAQRAADLRAKRARAVKNEKIRRAKAQKICGAYIKPEQLSGQKALIEGTVLFTVGERGEKMFGYGIQARDDKTIYFIRDPKSVVNAALKTEVSWILKTMGRTEALSQSEEDRFIYDKKSKTKFEMALIVKECKI